jgi:hypothetical protein
MSSKIKVLILKNFFFFFLNRLTFLPLEQVNILFANK